MTTCPTTSVLSLDTPQSNPPTYSPMTLVGLGTVSLLRLSTSITPALFSNELEYLYTGQGFGEAFEFHFDTQQPNADTEELQVDKLRKDLVFLILLNCQLSLYPHCPSPQPVSTSPSASSTSEHFHLAPFCLDSCAESIPQMPHGISLLHSLSLHPPERGAKCLNLNYVGMV